VPTLLLWYNVFLIPIAAASIALAVMGALAERLEVLITGVVLTIISPFLAVPPAVRLLRKRCV
jgi:antibiotic biosynthesis monooxygenase (ABM) superfamily enzyme